MEKPHIQVLLKTICQYNNVRITQTFTKDDTDWILVKCVPNSEVLELTYLQTGEVECYKSVEEAVKVIYDALYSSVTLK